MTDGTTIKHLRLRMIEDMTARRRLLCEAGPSVRAVISSISLGRDVRNVMNNSSQNMFASAHDLQNSTAEDVPFRNLRWEPSYRSFV